MGSDAEQFTNKQSQNTDLSGFTIEELFALLEDTARQLESGEVPLEESFTLYEKGMHMLKEVNGRIDLVEKKMLKFSGDGSVSEMENVN